jgi:16S rRNA (guanine527-N7)-methyltransferase
VIGDEARAIIAGDVSRETLARLDLYHALLLKWQAKVNLIAPATVQQAWQRHFLDSLQVFRAAPVSSGLWVDIGSGGGFPGLVCAIAAREVAPDLTFELVDSDIRKCAFLREVARQADVPVTVTTARVEQMDPRRASIVSARALAPLSQLLPMVHRHVRHDGTCLLQKGMAYREELETVRPHWHMDIEVLPSVTSADAVILRIGNLSHA